MRLPLLQFVAEQYPDVRLEKTVVIVSQHLLGTTFDFFKELFAKGLNPANAFVIGKCYSTSPVVKQWLAEAGVNVSPLSDFFDNDQSFDAQFTSHIGNFFREVISKVDFNAFEHIIILDDGGYLITEVHKQLPQQYQKIRAIEQTSAGFNRIKEQKVSFPIINVARSQAKLTVESPFIAEVAVHKLEVELSHYQIKNPQILIVGMGPIGQAMRVLLRSRYKVSGCDTIADRCDFAGNYQDHLGDFDVVVGATGQTIIGLNEFPKLKPGVLLASVSSSDREFTAVELRRLAPVVDCHQNVEVNNIRLANGGFPINFDGNVYSVAPEKIQLTHALLLAAVFEVREADSTPGLLDLGPGVQKRILDQFSKV